MRTSRYGCGHDRDRSTPLGEGSDNDIIPPHLHCGYCIFHMFTQYVRGKGLIDISERENNMDEPQPLFGGTIRSLPAGHFEMFDKVIDGLRCRAIYHHGMGHICGYIEIPKGTGYHESINSPKDCKWEMHGGASYFAVNGFPPENDEDGTHVIGFDCMHLEDAPHPSSCVAKEFGEMIEEGRQFRDLDYVWGECERVVKQINRME